MVSLQCRIFKPLMYLLRWQQATFPVHDVNALMRFRERSGHMEDWMVRLPSGVKVEKAILNAVHGDWLIPKSAPDDSVILYLHGGGICFGFGSSQRRMIAHLAQFAGLSAFGVDYRLIPTYLYPAAHEDCFNVYQTLVQQGKQVVLIGESSGGVLALATLLRVKAAGLPQPPLCVLISPTVDYAFRDDRIWLSKDPFASPKFIVELHKHYIAGQDTTLPDLAPIYADLSGLSPLYVLGAEHDVFKGEIERLSQAAQRYGLEAEFVSWPHVWHGWHLLVPIMPEAMQALKTLGEIIRQRVSQEAQEPTAPLREGVPIM